MSFYDPNLVIPPEVIQAVQTVREFAAKHTAGSEWQIGGLMPAQCSIGYYKAKMEDAHRQLDKTKVLLAGGADLVRDQAAEIARLNDGWDEMQRQLASALAERDAWKGIHDGQQRVYTDIGTNLGADMPRELVNDVARRRMAELAAARALISEVEHSEDTLPKGARYAIEYYRKDYPEQPKKEGKTE